MGFFGLTSGAKYHRQPEGLIMIEYVGYDVHFQLALERLGVLFLGRSVDALVLLAGFK